jgi:hypothetical protein
MSDDAGLSLSCGKEQFFSNTAKGFPPPFRTLGGSGEAGIVERFERDGVLGLAKAGEALITTLRPAPGGHLDQKFLFLPFIGIRENSAIRDHEPVDLRI